MKASGFVHAARIAAHHIPSRDWDFRPVLARWTGLPVRQKIVRQHVNGFTTKCSVGPVVDSISSTVIGLRP